MHALVRRALGPRSTVPLRRSCRVIAGRRYPIRTGPFHSSAVLRQSQDDPPNTADSAAAKAEIESAATESQESNVSGSEVVDTEDVASDRAPRAKDATSSYGSAVRRAARHRRAKELPPVELPAWFLRDNVRLHDELGTKLDAVAMIQETKAISPEASAETTTAGSATSDATPEATPPSKLEVPPETEPANPHPRYQLHQSIWNEVLANVRSGLSLPASTHLDNFAAQKVHLVLQCPKDGGIYFLDSVVENAALATSADLIRLDAQDIAEIGGNYLGEGTEPTPYSIRWLAYQAQRNVAKQDSNEGEEMAEAEEEVEGEEDEGPQPARGFGVRLPSSSRMGALPVKAFVAPLEDFLKSVRLPTRMNALPSGSRSGGSAVISSRGSSQSSDQWEEMKVAGMASAILEAAEMKMLGLQAHHADPISSEQAQASDVSTANGSTSDQVEPQRPLIIQIRDLKEIQDTANGHVMLHVFLEQIRRRRRAGQATILIGTVSSAEFVPSISRSGFRNLQSEFEDGPARTIVVTPLRSATLDSVLAEDERRRIREINVRHVQDMLRHRIPASIHHSHVLSEADLRLDSSVEYSSGLEEFIWPFDRVHRVTSAVLGLIGPDEPLTAATISKALQLLDSSDETKFQWAIEEAQTQKTLDESSQAGRRAASSVSSVKSSEARMRQVRRNSNAHEKKLLNGVVNPGELTFYPALLARWHFC